MEENLIVYVTQRLNQPIVRSHFERFLITMQSPSLNNLRCWIMCENLMDHNDMIQLTRENILYLKREYLEENGNASILLDNRVKIPIDLLNIEKKNSLTLDDMKNFVTSLQILCESAICADFQWFERSSFYKTYMESDSITDSSSSSLKILNDNNNSNEPDLRRLSSRSTLLLQTKNKKHIKRKSIHEQRLTEMPSSYYVKSNVDTTINEEFEIETDILNKTNMKINVQVREVGATNKIWVYRYLSITNLYFYLYKTKKSSHINNNDNIILEVALIDCQITKHNGNIYRIDYPVKDTNNEILNLFFTRDDEERNPKILFNTLYFTPSDKLNIDTCNEIMDLCITLIRNAHLASACQKGHYKIVQKYLTDDNIDILSPNLSELRKEVIRRYHEKNGIETNEKINTFNSNKYTPLQNAALYNNAFIAKYLLEAKADPNVYSNHGLTALHIATRDSNIEVLTILLNDKRTMINYQEKKNGLTALHYVQKGVFVALLVDHNANIEACDINANTPIHFTSINNVAKALIDSNANLNAINSFGMNAIMMAINKNQADIVKTLYEQDQSLLSYINQDNNDNIFHIIARSGSIKSYQYIINKCSNDFLKKYINAINNDSYTPLMVAVINEKLDIIKEYLKISLCNINAQDNQGRTVLHLAAKIASIAIIKELLTLDHMKLNIFDNNDYTALNYAWVSRYHKHLITANKHDIDCTKLLIEKGAIRRIINTDISQHFLTSDTIIYDILANDNNVILAATLSELINCFTHKDYRDLDSLLIWLFNYDRYITCDQFAQLLYNRLINKKSSKVVKLRVCNVFVKWIKFRPQDFQLKKKKKKKNQ